MQYARLAVLGLLAVPVQAQHRELTPAEQVAHVLSRLSFGARPGDAERVAAMGVDRWIAAQLRPWTIGNVVASTAVRSNAAWTEPVEALAARSRVVLSEPRFRAATVTATHDGIRIRAAGDMVQEMRVVLASLRNPGIQFAAGKFALAEVSERQLFEVIADFWENHFTVHSAKMPSREALIAHHREAVRPHALGRFRDLLGAVARSPAMLYYLDNHVSTRDGLNENYARELLELHTLGADGGYTQDDVIAVARALTGWGINHANPAPGLAEPTKFSFRAERHDSGEKVVLGHTLPAGRGMEDGEEVLDLLARHPSTARHIARKLARRLVSDDPAEALVERAAETFLRTDGQIAAVVETIVMSDEFFSRAAFRAKAKTPFEFLVSARRAFGIDPDTTTGTVQLLSGLGQTPYGRAEPDGWPDNAAAWMNAGAILNRVMLAADIAAAQAPFTDIQYWRGWSRYRRLDAGAQADSVIATFLGGIASEETRRTLVSVPGDGEERLATMVAIALGSPAFQHR